MPQSEFLLPLTLLLSLPFGLFFVLWLGGRSLNGAAGWIGALATAIGLVVSVWSSNTDIVQTLRFNWVTVGDFHLGIGFQLDTIGTIMLVVVHFIALLVQIYSTAYLKGDPNLHRYFAFIQLFLFSMLGIVLSGSLIVMYIFWELVGLCSYLLIGFWYQKPRPVWAAQKAFVLNRIGDAAFLTGILLIFYYIGSTDFEVLGASLVSIGPGMLTVIGICLFGGCAGKSAQFPLSGWLPDAMEGPTPVSALIHAATMVAAGIFLLARISFLLTFDARLFILVIGTITMLTGAVKAAGAWDIKRVLAFSTMSQLGLMVVAVGFGSWHTALFHLTTHAFFKAGLFLSSGSVIHAVTPHHGDETFDPQDMRNMGGLGKVMPVTFICFVICSAALAGLPLFSGFLSKDAIIAEGFLWAGGLGPVFHIFPVLVLLSAGLTAYYMVRQVWLVFLGDRRFEKNHEVHAHESPWAMLAPMVLLSVLSVFFWFSLNPLHAGESWYLFLIGKMESAHISWLPFVATGVSLVALLLAYKETRAADPFAVNAVQKPSAWVAWTWLNVFSREQFFLKPFSWLSVWSGKAESRWVNALVDLLARASVVLAHLLAWVDRRVVDGGVNFTVFAIRSAGNGARQVQNGRIQSYFLAAALGVVLLLVWLVVL